MAVADNGSNSCKDSSSKKQPCSCYTVSSLVEPILETSLVSNLKEKYVLGEQLGWGQFGVIRVCTEKSTGELLACKSIAKDRLVTSDDIRSVKLEIEIMTKLSGHPNVVDLKAVYEDEDNVHLVMELCAGGELFHQLEKHGRFCEVEAKVLFKDLMQVVLHCHEIGVVHRDLKPENILLAKNSSSLQQIKLADFGLATYVKPGQSLHGTVGSPFYIAPEVLSGGYNQTADVWSAGVILYILLSGMPPFWGKTKSQIFNAVRAADLRFPSNLWDRVTNSAKELVRGMLRVDPLQRLTAQQVLEHSWMKDESPCLEETCPHTRESCRDWDNLGSSSFSTLMTRNQDISFGANIMCEEATSTSRSPFSSFLAQPAVVSGGFSFRSNDDTEESSTSPLEFASSSPMSSMLSFAFFDPNPALDVTANTCRVDAVLGEANLSLCCGGEVVVEQQHKTSEFKRAGGTIGTRILGMHSKRNRTIGLGEREQLDLMVTESVIRWASCTNLPTASSLRSSLVC